MRLAVTHNSYNSLYVEIITHDWYYCLLDESLTVTSVTSLIVASVKDNGTAVS
jgi:hypothetical protein